MIRRLFWFSLGAAAAIYVGAKGRQLWHQTTPQAIGARVTDTATDMTGSVRDFGLRLRAAMAERESELKETLGLPQ